MGAPTDAGLVRLCEMAAAVAEGRGHQLGGWVDAEGGRRAECARCGRVAFVRVQGGLSGMIGGALSEPCRPLRDSGPAVA